MVYPVASVWSVPAKTFTHGENMPDRNPPRALCRNKTFADTIVQPTPHLDAVFYSTKIRQSDVL